MARSWRSSSRYWDAYPPYVPVATRKKQAAAAAQALRKKGQLITPVQVEGRLIAKTFWGKSWCDNLERYSDYASRLPRGRTYVRNGSVIDLQIAPGKVTSLVQGSSLYRVTITIRPVATPQWKAIVDECSGKIDSVIELLSGKLSGAVMEVITRKEAGLFPTPVQIDLHCSCPDWADMCKHVAATLYGVGARLDHHPELLFQLRGADPAELCARAATGGLFHGDKARSKGKALAGADLSSMFGIDIDTGDTDSEPPPAKPSPRTTAKPTPTKAPSAKAPSAKAPSAKAPSAKAPSAKAPSAKAPSAKAPSAKAPSAKATPAKAKQKGAPSTPASTVAPAQRRTPRAK